MADVSSRPGCRLKPIRALRLLLSSLPAVMLLTACLAKEAQALPSMLRVQIFEMSKDLAEVDIDGPCELLSPISKDFGRSSRMNVINRKGKLAVTFISSHKPPRSHDRMARASKGSGDAPSLINAERFILAASSRDGVGITVGRNHRRYRGRLVFTAINKGMRITNEVSGRDYVMSVVGSEAPPHCPSEALKAFAVLSLMIVDRKPDGDTIGDSTKEQCYKGADYATPEVERAVSSMFKKRLYWNGSLIRPYFHSTCAGGTSDGVSIFGNDAKGLDYLKHVKCTYCTQSPFWKKKTSNLSAVKLKQILASQTVPLIDERDQTGRPVSLVLSGDRHISGYEAWIKIGRSQGWDLVPGTRYDIAAPDGQGSIKITSSGAGHGVGLCQWGAVGLARLGKSADDILTFYFPKTKLK